MEEEHKDANPQAANGANEAKGSGESIHIELDLGATSIETLEVFVEEASDPELFMEIFQKNKTRYEVLKILLNNPNTPEEVRQEVAGLMSLPVPTVDALAQERKRLAEHKAQDIQKERLVRKIQKMNVSEKIKVAMKGSSEARGILSKDSNKLVILAVLDNPRITDSEIESMSKNRSTLEDALRVIAKNRDWMKNYPIMYGMVTNPKTPPAIAMRYIPKLKKRDIELLSKNKNVSEAVRAMSKKLSKAGKG